jgi:DNA-directed RNA polymerase specialized sigma24 family protein
VGRRDLAEDLTSEAFLALYRNIDSIDLALLPSWLFKVVKNRAIDHWRRLETERIHARLQPEAPALAAGADDPTLQSVLQSAALKPVHRICIVLRYVQGMT